MDGRTVCRIKGDPHAKFHHRGILGLAEAQEQQGRDRVMFRDGILSDQRSAGAELASV
jgi:hypothetical protein